MKKPLIDDVIADALWRFPDAVQGRRRKPGYIAIGRPRRDPDPRGDWICPIQIEHFLKGAFQAHGVGPLDALINAMRLLQQFFDMNTVGYLTPVGKRTNRPARTAQGAGAGGAKGRRKKPSGRAAPA